jgi:hypothetical protein
MINIRRATANEAAALMESFKQMASANRSIIKNAPCITMTAGSETDLSKFRATIEQQKALREKQLAWKSSWNELQKDLTLKFDGARRYIAKKMIT